jgi:hypothetical protein
MPPKTQIERRFRAEVPSVALASDSFDVSAIFDQVVRPIFLDLGICCDLIEVYTIVKRVQHREVDGVHYIVFDHALLESFGVLDGLCGNRIPAQTKALAMSRFFAEACRNANRGLLYAFFVVSALRIFPLLARAEPWLRFRAHRRWQVLLLLSHEAAHALPASHPVRTELLHSAAISASSLTNDLVQGMTGQLLGLLATDDEFSNQAKSDVDVWLRIRDEMQIDDDTIFAAFERVGTDPRFLDEIVCDSFSITALARDLQLGMPPGAGRGVEAVPVDVFIMAYRAFLHLRLLTYIEEVAANIEKLIDTTRIEPFKLVLWVEILFRGNLFVNRVMIVAETLLAEEVVNDLR